MTFPVAFLVGMVLWGYELNSFFTSSRVSNIDGALVGGASLKADDFAAIVDAAGN